MVCSLHTRVTASNAATRSGRALSIPTAVGQRPRGEVCVSHAYNTVTTTSTATTSALDAPRASAGTIRDRVKVVPPRPASTPPAPPSLIHSPVYVQKALIKPTADGAAVVQPSSSSARLADLDDVHDAKDANRLLWALKRVDRSLDELEVKPLPLQREIYELSRGPVGTATSSAFTAAAKVTVAATREAVKAAVPMGQWVVREGAKAAFSLMSRAMAEGAKHQQQQQQRGGTTKIMVKKGKK